MEKFFFPKNTAKFLEWLLETSLHNDWAVVIEYSHKEIGELLNYATKIPLPATSKQVYNSTCKLIAIKNFSLKDDFICEIFDKAHALSVHDEKEMLFLIADDFHEECFSCTSNFYSIYRQTLHDEQLIKDNLLDK